MARPAKSKNKQASDIAKDTIARLIKTSHKETPEVKQEIAEAIEELQDIVESDELLGGDVKEELPQLPTQEVDEEVVVPETAHGTRRLVGKCPVTKVPVYR